MFFCSTKEINSLLLKETNRLLGKGMSAICLKVAIEKKWRTQKFDFMNSKTSSPGQLLESFNSLFLVYTTHLMTCCIK